MEAPKAKVIITIEDEEKGQGWLLPNSDHIRIFHRAEYFLTREQIDKLSKSLKELI